MHQPISSAKEIIEEIKHGRMVVLVDDEHRENEGDLVLAAEFANAEHINFMAKYGRGLICLTLTESRCQQLQLNKMVQKNGARMGTNFTVSIEAAEGVTTGTVSYTHLDVYKRQLHECRGRTADGHSVKRG